MIIPFESMSQNGNVQLVQLTTNLPRFSQKVVQGVAPDRVSIRGASRAIAGTPPPLPRRNFLRRGDENDFFFRIGSSWTKIIDM
jgi:hypothetical protein